MEKKNANFALLTVLFCVAIYMNENIFDVVVVGGGISGLYSAYKIQKLCPDKSILVLEKEACFGGRMNTYRFYNTDVNVGAGIGRKEKDGLLMTLLDELKIEYKEFAIDMRYSDTICLDDRNSIYSDIDVAKTIRLLTRKYSKKEFSGYTFRKFAKNILGSIAYKTFVTKLGFSDFEDADSYDVLHYYGLDDNTKGGTGFTVPWSVLINKLSREIGLHNVRLSSAVISLTQCADCYRVKTARKSFYARQIVVASTIDTVRRLLPTFAIYNQVHGQPFLRVYGKFAKPIPELSVYTVVPGPLQKINPVNIRDGVYLIAYSDNEQAIFLNQFSKNNAKNREVFCTLIRKALGLDRGVDLELTAIEAFYWEIGTHYYQPLTDHKNRLAFIEEAQHPCENVLVVGEVIALHQGWSLGALESVESAVSKQWLQS